MKSSLRGVATALLVAAGAVALIVLYREHQREVALEAERDAPVVAPSRVAEAGGRALVALDSAEARRIGLRLAALHPAAERREVRLSGEVVPETERAAVLRAPVAGRLTVPTGVRWPALGERVERGAVVAQVSDARPLALPITGVVTSVGAQPGALVEAGQAILEVADYSHPLVRVTWTGHGSPPAKLSLALDERSPRSSARLVGPAPEADPVVRRATYLYRTEHAWVGATPGAAVIAFAAAPGDTSAAGALVPDGAVVQWEGLAWAYRRRAPGQFERVRIETRAPAPGGWVVGAPLAPGDSVVVRGAEELLSEEFRARVTVGDESGE
jgi:hypothetical protein